MFVAGCVFNRTGPVVGLSNTFSQEDTGERLWVDLPRLASELFPGVPVVGYERGTNLDRARAGAFQDAGRLRVWIWP